MSSDTRKSRALRATPILLVAVLMLRAFAFAEPIGDVLAGFAKQGVFSLNGVEVPIRREFYGIPLLDEILTHTTLAFAQLQLYPADRVAYWQSLVFLSDFAGVYGICLLESCRPSNKGTLLQYPLLLCFIGQFIPVGLVMPIFLFAAYITVPCVGSASRAITSSAQVAAVLPTLILAYLVPNFACYFHPDLEARHWWNWIWQLYPVWGSIIFFVASRLLVPVPASPQTLTQGVVAFLVALCTGTHWYVRVFSESTWVEEFVPRYFISAPEDTVIALRVLIQYDCICVYSAVALWLVYLVRDLKASGEVQTSYISILVGAIVGSVLLGIGSMLVLLWAWRNQVLSVKRAGGKTM